MAPSNWSSTVHSDPNTLKQHINALKYINILSVPAAYCVKESGTPGADVLWFDHHKPRWKKLDLMVKLTHQARTVYLCLVYKCRDKHEKPSC